MMHDMYNLQCLNVGHNTGVLQAATVSVPRPPSSHAAASEPRPPSSSAAGSSSRAPTASARSGEAAPASSDEMPSLRWPPPLSRPGYACPGRLPPTPPPTGSARPSPSCCSHRHHGGVRPRASATPPPAGAASRAHPAVPPSAHGDRAETAVVAGLTGPKPRLNGREGQF